ncbi:unnamed protein product [Paramecium octaurelia]|uniref:Uncharacterized protein n=1 Tax=Paramecium octaurelia TaxID=43137 RepID=A0A8S1Y0A8_PAROT|nr:unnamed protein product [Paramecium octaurelia]
MISNIKVLSLWCALFKFKRCRFLMHFHVAILQFLSCFRVDCQQCIPIIRRCSIQVNQQEYYKFVDIFMMCDSDSDVEILDFEQGLQLQQNTIENLEKELQIVITNSSYYQQQIQELLSEKNSLKIRVKELEEQNLQLENNLQKQNQTHQRTIEELSFESQKNEEKLRKHLESLMEQQKQEFERILEKQSEQINDYVKKLENQEEENNIIQNKLIATELFNCKLQSSLSELQMDIKTKAETRKCVQQFNEKLMGENINNLNKIESLSMQVDGLEEKLQKLTQQRDHFKKQFVDISQKILQYQQEISQSTNIKLDLKNKYEICSEQMKKFQQLLRESVDENKKLKQIIGQFQSQIEDSKYKSDLYIKENSTLKNQLNTLQQYYKEQISQLQQVLASRDAQIQQLSEPNKLTIKKLQKQNQSILTIQQQEQEKRQLIEQKIKSQQ